MVRRRHLLFICVVAVFPVLITRATREARSQDTQAPEATEKEDAQDEGKEEGKEEGKDEQKEKEAQPATVEAHVVPLRGNYVDFPEALSIDVMSLLTGGSVKQKPFHKVGDYLTKLGEDEKTKIVVFDLSDASLSMNPALLNESVRRISRLKKEGKKTIAWLEDASNVQLALAAQCDEVVMADLGGIDMPSMAMQVMFFRDAMDLLGVQASVVRAGDFKGATEPYTRAEMSPHLKQHYLDMLKTMNDALVETIAKGRGLTVENVRALQARRLLTPQAALKAGLVDRLAPYGSMRGTVTSIAGSPLKWSGPGEKARKTVSFFELMGMLMSGPQVTSGAQEESIVILHLSGAIMDGKKESSGSIVDGPTVQEIKKIADNDKVKAVVVRINSPGGSASASESIRQALKALAEKKPTVVSMGEVAASGGYWISCIGAPVYAEPCTLTGSVGVLSMKLSFGALLRRVGVHVESLTLDDSAAAFSIDRPWNTDEQEALGEMVDEVYDKFLALVGEARSMEPDRVRALAGGRVWSGTQAKENGLVDEIGGVDRCVEFIAEKAGLKDYKVIQRPVAKSGLDILDLIGGDDDEEIRGQLPSSVLRSLRSRGFSLVPTTTILRDSLERPNARPRIWALLPMEIQVR